MEKDEFEGVSMELAMDVYNKMKETDPSDDRYAKMASVYDKLNKAHIDNIERAEKISNERLSIWTKFGVAVGGMLLSGVSGYLVLRYNMANGNLQGRDAQNIFNQILKTKI